MANTDIGKTQDLVSHIANIAIDAGFEKEQAAAFGRIAAAAATSQIVQIEILSKKRARR
jgi:hypothetical protein